MFIQFASLLPLSMDKTTDYPTNRLHVADSDIKCNWTIAAILFIYGRSEYTDLSSKDQQTMYNLRVRLTIIDQLEMPPHIQMRIIHEICQLFDCKN